MNECKPLDRGLRGRGVAHGSVGGAGTHLHAGAAGRGGELRGRRAPRRRRCGPCKAVQVDPIKPTLKAPETKPFTLKCDKLLSNSAFNFGLRRYIPGAFVTLVVSEGLEVYLPLVGRCRLTLSNPS